MWIIAIMCHHRVSFSGERVRRRDAVVP